MVKFWSVFGIGGTVAASDLELLTVPVVGLGEFGCSISIESGSELVVDFCCFSGKETEVVGGRDSLRDPLFEEPAEVVMASVRVGKLTGDRGQEGSGGSGGRRSGGGSPEAEDGGFSPEV